jgi:hypothetical protein
MNLVESNISNHINVYMPFRRFASTQENQLRAKLNIIVPSGIIHEGKLLQEITVCCATTAISNPFGALMGESM